MNTIELITEDGDSIETKLNFKEEPKGFEMDLDFSPILRPKTRFQTYVDKFLNWICRKRILGMNGSPLRAWKTSRQEQCRRETKKLLETSSTLRVLYRNSDERLGMLTRRAKAHEEKAGTYNPFEDVPLTEEELQDLKEFEDSKKRQNVFGNLEKRAW